MHEDVQLKLAIAKQYVHHASFAGTPRQAVADGYSAVDSAFSALLLNDGDVPPRNHKNKLDKVRKKFPNAFDPLRVTREHSSSFSPGVTWENLEQFYKEWLQSRYEDFEMKPVAASSRVREASAATSCAIRFIAAKDGLNAGDFDARISTLAFGYDASEVNMAVGDMHGRLFDEAERLGEMYGSKLGTKMAATTNYCELDIVASDSLTQEILRENKELAADAARIYGQFIKLVEDIDECRAMKLSGGKRSKDCTQAELEHAPDFMLSMKARYHGASITEMGERWGRLLGAALSGIFEPNKSDAEK